ncbi:MAG: hypothetical protein JWO63_2059 [Frankiales bacterium]|nr:hypothetical protein [Frankiales bacterium]
MALAYELRCAREDARRRNIRTPLGVWACESCRHVSLSLTAFNSHLVFAHA